MSEEREAALQAWLEDYRKRKPYWSAARMEICRDAWQAALEWQAGRQSAGATEQKAVGEWVEHPHFHCPTLNWTSGYVAKIGGKLYAAPIGDNGAKLAELEAENFALAAGQCVHKGGVMMDEYGHTLCPLTKTDDAQPAESKRVELTEEELGAVAHAEGLLSHRMRITAEKTIDVLRALLARASAKEQS